MLTPAIEMREGAVAVEGRPILRHINVTIAAGEFVAVLGANGSGKSTLVRSMTGLRPLSSGSVELFGTPVSDFRAWHRIGFVPQRTNASGGVPATVAEVVASGRLSRRPLWRPASRADRDAVRNAISVVGLSGRERDGISTLSGGQQQRALIGRALAGEPELLFLDEPMAGVDLHVQEGLSRVLARLKESGATILLVAHELGPMAELIDRMVIMRDGRIAYDGPAISDPGTHSPAFGAAVPGLGHTHHHPHEPHGDYAPHVGSPLDPPLTGGEA